MPGLKEIKRRISSVKSTKQITKAMKMVAAAKFRKAQARITELKPYAEKMSQVLSSLACTVEEGHPLLQARPAKKVEILILTGDRGLCGAFNTNVMKAGFNLIRETQKAGKEVSVSAIGRKGADLLRRRKFTVRGRWVGLSGRATYADAQAIAKDIIENYMNETFDELHLVYTEFKSQAVQKVTVSQLLPLAPMEGSSCPPDKADDKGEYLLEPSQQAIFDQLLPKNVEIQIFRAILDAQASEEAARMAAMENATKNADDMIKKLTLQYNKARQAAITKELMDIVGGVEALKK
ncbi:MAG: ATP synthase F1 subunit gamma [Nitrospiraceae bacterium]|jgi:F-type H+-transporting ATPase subunit gamma|nr:ATP synthase F1 subunit gamma [Nitrospiraceae bacterium]